MGGFWRRPWLAALSHVYLFGLGAWAIRKTLSGDTWLWLLILSSLAGFLFLPVPIVLAIGVVGRRRGLIAGGGLAAALALVLYGGLFVPHPPTVAAAGPTVQAMSYNVWGFNRDHDAVIAASARPGRTSSD